MTTRRDSWWALYVIALAMLLPATATFAVLAWLGL